jgi:hypothetical protein
MIHIADLWLPILVSAAAVWFAAAVSWMALPHHKGDFKKLANEDAAMSAVRNLSIAPGVYFFPHMQDHDKAKTDPVMKEKFENGPHGLLQIWSPTVFAPARMGRNMVMIFIFYIIVGVFIAYLATLAAIPASGSPIAGAALQRGSDFMTVFRFTATAGVMAYCLAGIPLDICFNKPLRNMLANLIDGIAFGVITGAIFAMMWPKGV